MFKAENTQNPADNQALNQYNYTAEEIQDSLLHTP